MTHTQHTKTENLKEVMEVKNGRIYIMIVDYSTKERCDWEKRFDNWTQANKYFAEKREEFILQ